MRKQLTVCRYGFFAWINSTKVMMVFLYFVTAWRLFISPYLEFAGQLASPLGVFEPFLILSAMPYSAVFLPVLASVLLCDFPVVDASGKFVIYRTGKVGWFLGQAIFVLCVSFGMQLFLLALTVFPVFTKTFFANGWSLPVQAAPMSDTNILGVCMLDGTIFNQIRPFSLVLLSFLMHLLHTLTIGLVQYCFALSGKRVFGVLLNIAVLGAGFVLWQTNVPYRWLLPFAHALYAGHYDILYHKTYCDIRLSFAYFAVVLAGLFWIAYRLTKKSSFHNIEVVD